jgi:hypothetical protein
VAHQACCRLDELHHCHLTADRVCTSVRHQFARSNTAVSRIGRCGPCRPVRLLIHKHLGFRHSMHRSNARPMKFFFQHSICVQQDEIRYGPAYGVSCSSLKSTSTTPCTALGIWQSPALRPPRDANRNAPGIHPMGAATSYATTGSGANQARPPRSIPLPPPRCRFRAPTRWRPWSPSPWPPSPAASSSRPTPTTTTGSARSSPSPRRSRRRRP